MPVLTPHAFADVSLARAALEQHWALSAIAPERRALLMERVGAVSPSDETTLGMPIAESLAMLATAYEIAALGHLEVAVSRADGPAAELARETLALGASRAFQILRTLQLPVEAPELAVRSVLRLAAQAVVARQDDAFDQWSARSIVTDAVRALELGLDGQPWDARSRHTMWLVWLGLLRHPAADQLSEVRDRLATLREQRTVDEAPFLESLTGAAALHTRFNVFVTRQLAESAELLVATLHRRSMRDTSAGLTLHFGVARSATGVEHGLDQLLAWMHAAAVTIADGVTDQLELPGM